MVSPEENASNAGLEVFVSGRLRPAVHPATGEPFVLTSTIDSTGPCPGKETCHMQKKRTLEIAVIGAGHIAQQHLAVLVDLPEAVVTTLVDTDPNALEETALRFGIRQRLDSHQPILEQTQPDAVFVLVSVLKVAEVAADFLHAGIPTFLEKPPGLYTIQTRELASLAKDRQVPAMVGVNRRFYSTLLNGRERLLEEGPIRSVTVEAHEDLQRIRDREKFPEEVQCRWSAANGIHALDLLRFFGGNVAEVKASRETVEGPMSDCCTAFLRFEGGSTGRALMDWFAPGGHRVEVRSVGATLTSDMGSGAHIRYRDGHREQLEWDELDRQYKPGFYRQDQTFLKWVLDGGALPFPACSLEDAVGTMEMIDAIVGD
jgi:predicted dehydrogenase